MRSQQQVEPGLSWRPASIGAHHDCVCVEHLIDRCRPDCCGRMERRTVRQVHRLTFRNSLADIKEE
jgi:hypothetical protein